MPLLRELREVEVSWQRSGAPTPRGSAGSFLLRTDASDGLIRLQHGVFDSAYMEAITKLVLWRKPKAAIVVLLSGTLGYSYVILRSCTLLKLVADTLLLLMSVLGVVGLLSRCFGFRPPLDPLEWQISDESAAFVAALLANMFGATEGVLRVAASGLDTRLFAKVVLALYGLSVLGKLVSTATVVYIFLWVLFTVPFFCKTFRRETPQERGRWRSSHPEFWRDGEGGPTLLRRSGSGSESPSD